MRTLRIDNHYIIRTPLIEVINLLRLHLTNGKLKEVKAYHEGDANITLTCPHHKNGLEKEAACNVYVGDDDKVAYGYFRCWVCDEQGSFIKFVAECFDSTEEYAKQWLIKNFGEYSALGIDLGNDIQIGKSQAKKLTKYCDKSILDTYQSWHPYLAKRKLSRRTCEAFKVKYDPATRQIVFPCFDVNGNLLMAPTRSIETKTFYIPKDIKKPVYCLDFIEKKQLKTVIITEGPFDCLTAYEYGYPAIATLGRLSPEQVDKINHSCITTLYVMFDNDQAGHEFAVTLKSMLDKRILTVDVKIPAGKKDINDLSKEEFEKCIKDAQNSFGIIV